MAAKFNINAHGKLLEGFQITFTNGWMVSTQFAPHNYCSRDPNVTFSPDAEVAVIRPDGEFSNNFPGCPKFDEVRARVTPNELMEILFWAFEQE